MLCCQMVVMDFPCVCLCLLTVGLMAPTGSALELEDCTVKDTLPCTKYILNGFHECSPVNLAAQFPHLYSGERTDWPSPASSFSLQPFYKKYSNGQFYPGTNLTFTPPDDHSIRIVKGFEIMRYKSSSVEPACYIFDLSNATWNGMDDMQTIFQHEVYPMNPSVLYRFELYSLPMPNVNYDQFLSRNIALPRYTEDTDNPADWVFQVTFNNRSDLGIVEVSFNTPPEEYGFTQYDVRLRDTATGDLTPRKLVSQTHYTFTDVSPGIYKIWVKPYDEFFNDRSKCICRTSGGACIPCITTETPAFIMNERPTTQSAQTTTPTPVSTSSEETTRYPPVTQTPVTPHGDALKIALAVLGCILGLAIGITVIWIFYWRRHKGQGDPDTMKPPADTDSFVTVDMFKGHGMGNVNNALVEKVSLPRKKVFLIYEEDHECHRKVVELFGKYLQDFCHCDVWPASWRLEDTWVHQEIQQANIVILINSEAAYNVYMSGKCGGQNGSVAPVPTVSGTPGINCLLKKFLQERRQLYTNMAMVHFDYTAEKFIIPEICPGFNYTMMRHFTELLCHIHGLKRTDDLNKYDLPLDGKHLRLDVGRQLLDGIKEAGKFESNNPKWFAQKFGMFRSISNTSDDSKIDSGVDTEWVFDGMSVGVHTIQPPINGCYRNPLMLSPVSFGNYVTSSDVHNTGDVQPQSPGEGQFEFCPPDDIDDCVSKTLSEQMMSINKLRLYQREQDLRILEMQSRAGLNETDTDTYSIGGDSV